MEMEIFTIAGVMSRIPLWCIGEVLPAQTGSFQKPLFLLELYGEKSDV